MNQALQCRDSSDTTYVEVVQEIKIFESRREEQETVEIGVMIQSTRSIFYLTGFVPIDEDLTTQDNVPVAYIELSNINDGSSDENGWTTGLIDDGLFYVHVKCYLQAQGFRVVSNRRSYY